jgi:hypothetical protein
MTKARSNAYGTTTLGSTTVTLGSTSTSISGLTVSNPTVTGTLTAASTSGTSGQFLSSTGTGVQWATPVSGSLTLLSTTTLSGTSITISGISQSYKSLQIITSNIANDSGQSGFYLRFNGDSSASYNFGSTRLGNASGGTSTYGNSYIDFSVNTNTSGNSFFTINMPQYSLTSGASQIAWSGGNASLNYYYTGAGWYSKTAGISSIIVGDTYGYNFTRGTVQIYGVN